MTLALLILATCYQPYEIVDHPTYTEHYPTGFCRKTKLYAIGEGDFVTRTWPDGTTEYIIGCGQSRGLVFGAFISREYWAALLEKEGRR